MFSSARRWARLILFAGMLGRLAAAESAPASTGDGGSIEADPMKIEGIFNTDLPRTERKRTVRFILHPHFGDLTNRDYLRMPLGVRWGASERLEVSGQVEAYLAHGLGGERFGRELGFSGIGGGVKYRWAEWLRPYWDTASGVNVAVPMGAPPADVTDGLRHLAPYVTFAHTFEDRPDFTFFVGLMEDFVARTGIAGARRKNEFADNSWAVTPGFVWHRGAFHYTVELGYATSALVSDHADTVVTLRPAISWDLPRRLTFNSKGRWVFGLGLRATRGPDGTDFGVSGKFRGEFNLRRLLRLGRRSGPVPIAERKK